jgi:hypothetical protein
MTDELPREKTMYATCTPAAERRRHFDHERGNTVIRSLNKAAPRIKAAEELAQRLKEAGIHATPRSIPHDDEACAVLVYITGHLFTVLRWLEHYAVPVSLLSNSSAVAIFAYSAKVSGQDVTLVITHREPT